MLLQLQMRVYFVTGGYGEVLRRWMVSWKETH